MSRKTSKYFSRKKIWEIASQYARTEAEYSRDYFSREYAISYSTFYTLLERAVVESIVDEQTVLQMAKKAANNAAAKAGTGAKQRSADHYKHLILKRKVYMLPKIEAMEFTVKYAYSAYDKKTFCKENFIDTKLFDRTLYKAIIDNWVTFEVVEKIKTKSIQNNGAENVSAFWEQLLAFRNENRKNQG